MVWGLGGPEEDYQLHHCCWTGRVSEREEEEEDYQLDDCCWTGRVGEREEEEEDYQLHHCCWTGRVGEREEEGPYTTYHNTYDAPRAFQYYTQSHQLCTFDYKLDTNFTIGLLHTD